MENLLRSLENHLRPTFRAIIQNMIYVLLMLNRKFNISDKEFSLYQFMDIETLKVIDEDSLFLFFNLLTQIDIDSLLLVIDQDGNVLEDPRNNPLDIDSLINKRPAPPEPSDDFETAYNNAYMNQIELIHPLLSHEAYFHGYNRQSKITTSDFAERICIWLW